MSQYFINKWACCQDSVTFCNITRNSLSRSIVTGFALEEARAESPPLRHRCPSCGTYIAISCANPSIGVEAPSLYVLKYTRFRSVGLAHRNLRISSLRSLQRIIIYRVKHRVVIMHRVPYVSVQSNNCTQQGNIVEHKTLYSIHCLVLEITYPPLSKIDRNRRRALQEHE